MDVRGDVNGRSHPKCPLLVVSAASLGVCLPARRSTSSTCIGVHDVSCLLRWHDRVCDPALLDPHSCVSQTHTLLCPTSPDDQAGSQNRTVDAQATQARDVESAMELDGAESRSDAALVGSLLACLPACLPAGLPLPAPPTACMRPWSASCLPSSLPACPPPANLCCLTCSSRLVAYSRCSQ